jgi:rRNA maturation RNase YbeY
VLDDAALTWRPGANWRLRARAMVQGAGPPDGLLQVVLTGDRELHALNKRYRKKNRPTDVLSFSYLTAHERSRERLLRGRARARRFTEDAAIAPGTVLVGQVLISLDTIAKRNSGKRGPAEADLLVMLAHGLLHVLGFDHEDDPGADEMEARQQELLQQRTRSSRRREAVKRA